jgi:hypothetical protein
MNAVVEMKTEQTAIVPQPALNPMQMLALAVQQGADLDKLRTLMDLKREYEADEARKAFVAAMAEFKADPPEILKSKHVSFTTQKGKTEYDHATLADVCAAAIQGLARVGISHRWDTAQQEGRIKVTCVLTHKLGHSESVSLHSAADDSGGKNAIQAIGSAVTYLQRYTLLAATGLAAKDMDDDGKRSERPDLITEKQAADLNAKISEVGANKAQFLKFLKVEKLSDLEAKRYTAALQALEDKARGAR